MPPDQNIPPLDNRLARLGREWFADARRKDAADDPRRAAGSDVTVGDDGGLLDWLFGGDTDSSDGGDGGGDGGD